MNAHLSIFVEGAMLQTGSDAILFQESVAGFKVIFSVLISALFLAVEPIDHFGIQIEIYPVCLLVAASGLALAVTVSMTALIATSSALTFLVVEQFCELMMILIGHTLNPTRFTTFKEAILSFIGFGLAIPGQILFFVSGDLPHKRPTDVEPFQISPEVAENQGAGLDDET
jgi:hypothetical protein